MTDARITALAAAITALSGALWGLYWLPVRGLDGAGLGGAWGTAAITLCAAAVLAPFAWRCRGDLRAQSPAALVSVMLGGAAFALYSVGFVYGRVAMIILLYFLTPVWSTLIARFVMGWQVPPLRLLAIAVGLAGLAVMLGAGPALPLPRGPGEWMALAAGVLWSVATTGMRTKSALGPAPSAFVFALGAALTALLMAPLLGAPLPPLQAWTAAFPLALGAGALWWGLSAAALMWAALRLEPARTGILLMTEVLVGAVSAAVLAQEHLPPRELAGGALVLTAALLELWPARRGAAS